MYQHCHNIDKSQDRDVSQGQNEVLRHFQVVLFFQLIATEVRHDGDE